MPTENTTIARPAGLNEPLGNQYDTQPVEDALAAAERRRIAKAERQYAKLLAVAVDGKLTDRQADELASVIPTLGTSAAHFRQQVQEIRQCRAGIAAIAKWTPELAARRAEVRRECQAHDRKRRELLEQLDKELRDLQREAQELGDIERPAKEAHVKLRNLRNDAGFVRMCELAGFHDLLTANLAVATAAPPTPKAEPAAKGKKPRKEAAHP